MPSWSGSGSESEWSSASSSPAPIQANLESFLHSVTPLVPTKPLSLKSSEEASGNHDESSMEYYFVLEDVWQCYDEWSAYGVGTPVVLNNYNMSSRRSSSSHGRHDHQTTVVQYYAPYLSAIQLYTNVVMSWPETTTTGTATSNSSNNNMDDNIVQVQEPAAAPRELRNPVAYPYFQYCETISPYWRLPLVDKIAELAADGFPGLISLKSIDLSPASWMSVAWCPIYHIPFKGKVEDLSTYFLTFHTLSSCFHDYSRGNYNHVSFPFLVEEVVHGKSENKISLPPFGLSTLRMQGDIWINQVAGDYEKLINLYCAADSWLKQLKFHHRDFDYYQKKNLEVACIYN